MYIHIECTVYGKISEIIKTNATIYYNYDAGGNRISKVVSAAGANKATYYVRDASGNVMSVYTHELTPSNNTTTTPLSQTELHLYGSSRLGVYNVKVDVQNCLNSEAPVTIFTRANKFFELSNHLGNVLVTISDKKLQHAVNNSTVDYYVADVVTANDYYPFGMQMPGRKFAQVGGGYRYGFNWKENDNEVKGEGNQQDYGFRIYDPRLGRFLSQDPLFKSYPWYTPYQFAGNKPIAFIDRDGLEEARADEIAYAILNMWDANHVRINKNVAFELAQNSRLPDPADGKQDAFRHTVWNAMNARDIGADDAEPFATKHESGSEANDPKSANYDPVAVKMDLFNNAVGRRIGAANEDASDLELGTLTIQALANGELKEIKIGIFNISTPDINGKLTIQSVSLPISAKGNPITTNTEQANLIKTNGHNVEGNASKILVNSSIPTVTPNKNKTPQLSSYNGGTTTGHNIQPVHSEQPAGKKPIPVKL